MSSFTNANILSGLLTRFCNNKNLEGQETEETRTEPPIRHRAKCHIVVPYSKGLCESYKTICSKYGIQVYFKGSNTLKIYWYSQRAENPSQSKAISYTGLNVAGLSVMMSTMWSQPEPLRKET